MNDYTNSDVPYMHEQSEASCFVAKLLDIKEPGLTFEMILQWIGFLVLYAYLP